MAANNVTGRENGALALRPGPLFRGLAFDGLTLQIRGIDKMLLFRGTQRIELARRKCPGRLSFRDCKMSVIAKFLKDESGATAIEYGLIAAGISVAIIATVAGLGGKLNSTFTSVQGALN